MTPSRACAEARSWPKGFSMTTRFQLCSERSVNPCRRNCEPTFSKAEGGMER